MIRLKKFKSRALDCVSFAVCKTLFQRIFISMAVALLLLYVLPTGAQSPHLTIEKTTDKNNFADKKSAPKKSNLPSHELYRLEGLLFKAIKAQDLEAVRQVLESGAAVKATNSYKDSALVRALHQGTMEIVKLLIEFGADVNENNIYGKTPLMHAVELNSLPLVQFLLSQGSKVNHANRRGETALTLAVSRSFLNVSQILVQAAAEVHVTDNFNRTLLMRALWATKHPDQIPLVVQFLLDHKVDVNAINSGGSSALIMATQKKLSPVVKILLAAGADPNVANDYGYTALMQALHARDEEAAKSIIRAGAEINAPDSAGLTALMYAINNGLTSAVQLLLNTPGVDLDLKDKKGHSVFSLAAYGGSIKMIKQLLPYAKVSVPKHIDILRQTELLLGTVIGRNYEAMQFLLDQGIHPDASTLSGLTALMLALKQKEPKALQLLLTRGANPNAQTENGLTPLHIAIQQKDYTAFKWLLLAGANVNAAEKLKGYTPLIMAVRGEQMQMVQDLLDTRPHRVQVNGYDLRHETALMHAIGRRNSRIVKLLLQRGANPNAKSRDQGHTPLMMAVWEAHYDGMIQDLLLAGAKVNAHTRFDAVTALMLAAKRGHYNFVRLLLLAGADPNKVNTQGQDALMLLALHGMDMRVAAELKKWGADLTRRDIYGQRAVDYLQKSFYFKDKSIIDQNNILRSFVR